MTRLADLLGHNHPLFAYNLAQLEKASGNSGIDVRLLADSNERAHRVIRALGLDSSNTLAIELYQALNTAVSRGEAEQLLASSSFVIAMLGSQPISLNLQDVIENAHHQLSFDERMLEGARRHLRAEIVKRYAVHDRTSRKMVERLADEAGLRPVRDVGHPTIKVSTKKADLSPIVSDKQTDSNGLTEQSKNTPYILCVGDIITDAFIKLSENHAEVKTDEKGYKRLSFELGAKLPYDSVDIVEAVECSPNAAVSMSRLGLNTGLISWLGDDEPGKGMVEYLKTQHVAVDNLVIESGMKSNYHYVLRYGADRTKLQRFEDYSYQWHEPARTPEWLYLGVLGEKTWPLHEALLGYLDDNPRIKLAFQPGMYHLMWGTEKMASFYKRAEIVIMNREEAAEVTGKDRGDVPLLIQSLHDLGVTLAIVTDGADGAYASDGSRLLFMPNYPDPAPPFDRTGAGDAFASTITAALALGESLETALLWAPINSMNVVQKLGAQAGLQTRAEIENWLKKASSDYKPKQL